MVVVTVGEGRGGEPPVRRQ